MQDEDDDDGPKRAISVALGQTFAIELAAESSAGYEWIPIRDSMAICYLGCEKVSVVASEGASFLVLQRYTFRALAYGEHSLVLHYKRRWERTVRKQLDVLVDVSAT